MKDFKSVDWLKIGGRGWIAAIRFPVDESLPKISSTIKIDGFKYKIQSIEYAMCPEDSLTRDEIVGIVVNSPPLHKHF